MKGECGGCSAGIWDPRILGREMITKMILMLSAQIPGVSWFSSTVSFFLFLWQNAPLDTMDLFHSASHRQE